MGIDYVNELEENQKLVTQLMKYQYAYDILIKYKNSVTLSDSKKLKGLNL